MPRKRLNKFAAQKYREQGLKWCPRCETAKPFAAFAPGTNSLDGLRGYCRQCSRTYRRTRAREQQKVARPRRAELKKELVDLLGGQCARCGYAEFAVAFDFHHVDGTNKQMAVSELIMRMAHYNVSDQFIVDELDKCALLCANCHGAYHAGAWTAQWIKRESLGWTLEESGVPPSGLGATAKAGTPGPLH